MEKETAWSLVFEAKKEAFLKGHPLILPVRGWSMFPVLMNGDMIKVIKVESKRLIPGDIVVFDAKSFVAHRLLLVRRKGTDRFFITKGDSLPYCDGSVSEKAMVGRVVSVRKPWFCLSLDGGAGRALNLICLFLSVVRFWTPGLAVAKRMVRFLRRV